eukprot:SAG11_NODE_2116_length_3792_cov_5.166802_5_plen_86_part_00
MLRFSGDALVDEGRTERDEPLDILLALWLGAMVRGVRSKPGQLLANRSGRLQVSLHSLKTRPAAFCVSVLWHRVPEQTVAPYVTC